MSEIDKFIQAAEPCEHSAIIGMSLTAADALTLVTEIGELRTELQLVRMERDNCMTGRDTDRAAAEAEEALAVKWQQRAERAEERLEQAATALAGAERDRAAAEAEAADLRKRLVGAHQVENILREELATVTALALEADWLEMVAANANGEGCDACPYYRDDNGPGCHAQCDEIDDKALDLATRIRAWRESKPAIPATIEEIDGYGNSGDASFLTENWSVGCWIRIDIPHDDGDGERGEEGESNAGE